MPSILANANANLALDKTFNKPVFIADGGVVESYVSGGIEYIVHKFLNTGSATFTVLNGESSAQILVVGGGGSGANGAPQFQGGSGGGAGGVIYSGSYFLKKVDSSPSVFNVFVGAGGAAGLNQNGQTSSFNPAITYALPLVFAIGGGAGSLLTGSNGGSGGGGAYSGSGIVG